MFLRACVRAGISLVFTKGFNPRPKISLPLPRPVGVVSDDELIVICAERSIISKNDKSQNDRNVASICETGNYDLCDLVRNKLSARLPAGLKLVSVKVIDEKAKFFPSSAVYILEIKPEYFSEELKSVTKQLLDLDEIILRRGDEDARFVYKTRQKRSKMVDVRCFIRSIEVDDNPGSPRITVNYEITSAGTIRIQEVLELLKLDTQMLAAPIKRTCVQWKSS